MTTLEHPSFVVHSSRQEGENRRIYEVEHRLTREHFSVSVERKETEIWISRYGYFGEEKTLSRRYYRYSIWLDIRTAICESLASYPLYRLPLLTHVYRFKYAYDIAEYYLGDQPPCSFKDYCKLNFLHSDPMEKIVKGIPFLWSAYTDWRKMRVYLTEKKREELDHV